MSKDHHLRNKEVAGADADRDLSGRFAALRRAEEQYTPEFVSLRRRRPRSSGSRALQLAAAACVVIVLAAIVWQRASVRWPQDRSVASITEWKAPTDFLLETPGRELLRTVPAIGEWPGYVVTDPHPRPADIRKKTSH
jgi:hypothetical protein